jgi:hypothetical protein
MALSWWPPTPRAFAGIGDFIGRETTLLQIATASILGGLRLSHRAVARVAPLNEIASNGLVLSRW